MQFHSFICKCAQAAKLVSSNKKKSNLHYTCGTTPKRVMSGRVNLHGLVPGQHSSEEMLQR